jgi:uroporphyrinogen-III decarboxylase
MSIVSTAIQSDTETLYAQRLNRYMTAMRNEKPDMVPIRPFVAEVTAVHAGYTCQQVTHDYEYALRAARRCATDFDWDAVVCNMVYVWTGLTQALGLKYYGIPGIHIEPNVGFQYREPGEDDAFMKADEYDQLIDDPTGFLYNVWLPRVSADMVAPGQPATYRHNLALVKGGMAMMQYFGALGHQNQLLRQECGTVSAIAGILKAPFDIIADKLRGYIGLVMDMHTQPDKVLAACEALVPHLTHVALTTADPAKQVPIGFWMHRGCVPFINHKQFASHFWPTLKPIIEELWAHGHQTLFYAEGKWNAHLDAFSELPDQSIVYHVDQDDIFAAHRKIGHKFCLSGGIPNRLLSFGTPEEVRECCRRVIEGVAADGGYIMDAGAIMQNDTSIENLRAMTEATRRYGVYSGTPSAAPVAPAAPVEPLPETGFGLRGRPQPRIKPGVCVPWEEKRREIPEILGDEALAQRVWDQIEGLGNTFIWQCLLSF